MQLSRDQVFDHLGEVRRALGDLLEVLEANPSDQAMILETQRRVQGHVDVLGDPDRLRVILPASDHDRLRRELEDWMRLVALASASVVRNREAALSFYTECTGSVFSGGSEYIDQLSPGYDEWYARTPKVYKAEISYFCS